jgi:hypothetical protein
MLSDNKMLDSIIYLISLYSYYLERSIDTKTEIEDIPIISI